jgi:integrin-linked kinase-associated serine/threonine phosphatase 2C
MSFSLSSGFESVQGRRWTMEDTHVLLDDINEPFKLPQDTKRAYYAVYDGHGGKTAADITAELLHKNIIEDPAFVTDIDTAINNGFEKTDQHILKRSSAEKWTNGTTTVTCFVINDTLIISNTGDSEAVLAQNNGDAPTAVLLTEKHKPTEPEERKRVEQAGGQVIFGRVLGSLAVSKAMGDIDFKHPYNKAEADFVSAVPYINKVKISKDNPFLIIACDGLWDKLTYQDAVDFVAKSRSEGKTPTQTAQLIVKHSLDLGSFDNVTAIIVYFSWEN